MSPRLLALALLLPVATLHATMNPDFAPSLDAAMIGRDTASLKRLARWNERLRKWLGPFDAALAATGLDAAAMASAAVAASR